MVVRRPKGSGDSSSGGDGPQLMEHLVKKSLDVNPGLRTGKDTGSVLQDLKDEAAARNSQGPTSSRPKLSKAERKKQTIHFFLEQKREEFEESIADVLERERKLQAEKAEIQGDVAEELSDFLGLMSGGAEAPETREVLRHFRKFIAALGLTEDQLLDRARRG